MAAPQKVSNEQLAATFAAYGQNLAATASALHMKGLRNLRERLSRMGLLDRNRSRTIGAGPIRSLPGPNKGPEPESQRGPFRDGSAGRTLPGMSTPQTHPLPTEQRVKPFMPLRLPMDLREQLRVAARQLTAAENLDHDDSDVLEDFVREAFATYLKARLKRGGAPRG